MRPSRSAGGKTERVAPVSMRPCVVYVWTCSGGRCPSRAMTTSRAFRKVISILTCPTDNLLHNRRLYLEKGELVREAGVKDEDSHPNWEEGGKFGGVRCKKRL